MPKTMSIRIIILFLILSFCNCSIIKSQNKYLGKANKSLENEFIKMVPNKGIVVYNDSLYIGDRSKILLRFLEKHSLKYSLLINEPRSVTFSTIDSPPPNEDGTFDKNWHHTPDEYFTDYSAILKVDSLIFNLYFYHRGKEVHDKKQFTDSLKVTSIRISKPLKAGLYDNLEIGDSFEQIFNHYEKPGYCCQPGQIISRYGGSGVVFYIECDKSKIYYGKIKGIEINNLPMN